MKPKQTLPIIIRFNEELNPGNISHLKEVIKNELRPKGLKIEEEGGYLVVEL